MVNRVCFFFFVLVLCLSLAGSVKAAAPVVSNLVLNSSSGTNSTNENLTLSWTASDADGDSIKNITNWYVNGTSISVLNMPMEGGSNSTWTKDYSDYGNNGTVSVAIWNATGGYDGFGAYEFDGVNDRIEVPHDSSLNVNQITVSAWVYRKGPCKEYNSNNGNLCYIIEKDYSGTVYPFILSTYQNNATLWFNVGGTQGKGTSNINFSNNEWHHIAGTYNGSEIRVYQDGELVNYTSYSEAIGTSTDSLIIGWQKENDRFTFNGSIDEVRIYNRSLSAEQIQALYQNRTDLIVSQETSAGDVWNASITPNDGTQDGATIYSNNLTVLSNGIPIVSNLVLNSSSGTNTSSENLTVTWNASDADGDNIKNITNWYVNGSSIAVLNMPFEGGSTSGSSAGPTNGSTKDYSGFGNNGTVVANTTNDGPQFNATGGYDGFGAYEFDGDGDYVDVGPPSNFDSNVGCVLAWVYLKEDDETHSIFSASDTANDDNFFEISRISSSTEDNPRTLRITVEISNSRDDIRGSTEINVNNWYHTAVCSNGSEYQLYVNGEVQTLSEVLGSNSGDWISDISGKDNALIGRLTRTGSIEYFNGTIDDVHIYNRSLSAEQIQALYENRTDLIVSQETQTGDVWNASITPNDGTQDGTTVFSNNLTVLEPPIHNIDTGQNYSTIQSAIDAANTGDTISIDAGTYTENVVVNKSVTLTGAGIASTTVQNATSGSDVFNIIADWVNISGFKIEGALDSNYASIHINGANYTNISNNNVTGSWYGIHVDRGLNNTLFNNTATLNQNDGILLNHSNYTTVKKNIAKDNSQAGDWGNGICLGAGENYNNTIEDNTINGNYHGIYLDISDNNTIANNTVSLNSEFGIYLYASSNNTLTNNTMKSNDFDFYSDNVASSNTVNTNLFNNTKASFTYSGDIKVNSSSSPASDPSGYNNIGKYLNVTNLSAGSWVYLNISYSAGDLGNLDESTLRMWKHNDSWSQVSGTNGVETTQNYVYANITDFSVFAPMASLEEDTTPPVITIQSPLNQTYNTSTIWFNVTLDDTGSWCGYALDGAANVTMTNSTGNWNAQNTLETEGGHSVIFSCNDTSGNMNSSNTVWFTVDTTLPTVTITTPVDGATVNIFNDTVNGTITDNRGIDWVKILLNGTVVHSWSAGGSTSITIIKVVNYTAGADNEINVTANDTANNIASSSVTITVLSTSVNQTVNVTANETIVVDISNTSDVVLELFTAENVTGDINVTTGRNITEVDVTSLIGIATEDEEVGKYIAINVSDEIQGNLTWTILKMFYTLADLDRNGNGVLGDSEDIDPSKLKLYWHNTSGNTWLPLTTGASYEPTGPKVFSAGVNQTASDGYLGNLYANISHYSVYGMFGSVYGGEAAVTTAPSSSRTKNVIREMNDPTVTFPSKLVPGESASLTILLENTGNVVERVVATILDLPEGWIVTGESSVNLKPEEKKTMTLTIKIPPTATGQESFTIRLKAVDSMKTWDKPLTVSISEVETKPEAIVALPTVSVSTTGPQPATTILTKTAPPTTIAPPETIEEETPSTSAPEIKKPTITTKPPTTTAPPTTAPSKEEKKGICGPTIILLITALPLTFWKFKEECLA